MPAFGWSVGDCIASADLIIHILKSLRDTGGASSEFQKLQTDLEFLKLVLERIKIVDVITPQTPAAQAASAAKFVNASQATLTALLDKISNFKNSLGESASKGKVKSGLRKVQWALMYADDVAKFRQILASQTASLTLFLETQNMLARDSRRS
ncbi:hypothetical protein K432DRAFT_305835 [Lepidopterella palustris CBS 459.81]|uniref:NACHT-NTPase and P-loop NTPases N-terminal domain-containing protein n=1 Tax=Lepidopterella palustris CBS 459.81 TaxID=1314670 RepID=A0A8E2E3J5_9PEZI|nr:hypothetical protein K432DRAFT_305835 [Lepidopterella palustris CBS 459.81]